MNALRMTRVAFLDGGIAYVHAEDVAASLRRRAEFWSEHHDEVLGRAKAKALDEAAATLEQVVASAAITNPPRRRWWRP